MTGIVLLIINTVIVTGLVLSIALPLYHAKKNNMDNFVSKQWKKPATKAIAASLLAILCGLIVGCIILLCFSGKTISGIKISFKTGIEAIELVFTSALNTGRNASGNLIFGFNGKNIGNILFQATPLIIVGLSVGVAFKTGLFNIGAPGQYLMSTAATLIIALSIPTTVIPSFFVWVLALLGGMLAGALWGAIPGLFKAFLNVNEVITCIMTNWIAANLVTSLFDNNSGPFKYLLDPSQTKSWAFVFKTSYNNVATAKLGLDVLFKDSQVNAGIFVAIALAFLIYVIMNKTTFGYKLKACGSNRNAAKYAGINEKGCIITSMAIAGALAGCGASLYYLSGNTEFAWSTYQSLPAVGFNGIPVALLAFNNPIGIVFASCFMAYLDVAGMQIKYMTSYNEYITSIISSVIVYFSAFSLFIQQLLSGKVKFKNIFKKRKKPDVIPIPTNVNGFTCTDPVDTKAKGGE